MHHTAIKSVVDRSILICGGASGLGAATARFLSEHGARVTILDVHEAHGLQLSKELQSTLFVAGSVLEDAAIHKAIDLSVDKHGPLFGVVNCAGIAPPAKLVGRQVPHPMELFQKVVQLNLHGTFNVCRLAAGFMLKAKLSCDTDDRGVIINTSSIAAYEGQIGQCAYAASKGGIAALTLPMARELAQHRIRVNAIAPGVMRTPLLESLGPVVKASLERTIPYPSRLGEPVEFAAMVKHILENQYLNGSVLRLDGGLRMGS